LHRKTGLHSYAYTIRDCKVVPKTRIASSQDVIVQYTCFRPRKLIENILHVKELERSKVICACPCTNHLFTVTGRSITFASGNWKRKSRKEEKPIVQRPCTFTFTCSPNYNITFFLVNFFLFSAHQKI
jgi:hypothetical protein